MNISEDTIELLKAFNTRQLRQLQLGAKSGVDISAYAIPTLKYEIMEVFRIALEENIDISPFVNQEFDYYQVCEIIAGIEQHLDASKYAYPNIRHDAMHVIRENMPTLDDETLEDIIEYAKQGRSGIEIKIDKIYKKEEDTGCMMDCIKCKFYRMAGLNPFAIL